jgi:hypothetical protein
MNAVQEAVYTLTDLGVTVLSPADPRVVDQFGDFLFVASDYVRELRLVQNRHLASIAVSDFLWLVAPEGYVGQSGAMEIGFAVARQTPVFSTEVPSDLTIRQYVIVVEDVASAVRQASTLKDPVAARPTALLDPELALAGAHDDLDLIARMLLPRSGTVSRSDAAGASMRIRDALSFLG